MPYPKTALASVAASLALALVSGSARADVVINELSRNGQNSPANANDFVELYNNGDEAVDIGGWQVRSGTNPNAVTTNGGLRATVPTGTMLEPDSYWLITRVNEDAGTPANGQNTMTGNLPAATQNVDGVVLRDATGNVVDTLLYGTNNSVDNWLDDTGAVATSFAPKPEANKSLYRKVNGVDTNMCGDDFVLSANAAQMTPGAANYVAPPAPDGGTSSSGGSSSGRSSSSSSGGRSSSSSSGAAASSSGGRGSSGTASSGGKNAEDGDDGDNSNLAADEGGCNAAAATPGTLLLSLGALFLLRRRRR